MMMMMMVVLLCEQLLSNGSLHISKVYMEDDGKYSCTVGNSGGFDQDDAYLHVARKDASSFTDAINVCYCIQKFKTKTHKRFSLVSTQSFLLVKTV